MQYKHLLAKSSKNPDKPKDEETLVGHTEAVARSAQIVLKSIQQAGAPEKVSKNWERFERLVLTAAVFHDLGKATNVFQGMLVKSPNFYKKTHPVRHEILSALLIAKIDSPIKKLIAEILPHEDVWLLSWLVGGHHLKLSKNKPYFKKETDNLVRVSNIPETFVFWGTHPDVKSIVKLASSLFKKSFEIPPLMDIEIEVEEPDDIDEEYLEKIVNEYIEESEEKGKNIESGKELIAFAKATLVSADVAGSALTKGKKDPFIWIKKHLDILLTEYDLECVVQDRLNDKPLRPFQNEIAQSRSPVTITIAGCGSGKTIAAYAWAKKHAKKRKLYFCYPTTGTASSGFEDYLLAQTELERTLVHSRSQVDLERMLSSNDDLLEENQRLNSLHTWSQQVIACTVDTVLGLIQNHRRALFSFPVLTNGAFVFDEIHSYDKKLFGALLVFLRVFSNAPVLLMTASMPENRILLLRNVLGERMGEPIRGEAELENLKRYVLIWKENRNDCWEEVIDTLKDRKNVLWVCNTVNDAIQIYEDALLLNLPVKPILYHSRFRYKDRVIKQSDVISSFNAKNQPSFVIATQVCEMSLDISADLLVSALSPFSSLIQRLGRLNRRVTAENEASASLPCRCFVYDFRCKQGKPYREKDLKESRELLDSLGDNPCSQTMLSDALSKLQQQEDIAKYSAWLDGLWESDQRPLRSGGAALTVLLKQDLPEIKSRLKFNNQRPNFQTLASWTIPVLFNPNVMLEERFGGFPVIDENYLEYDIEKGARWRKNGWLMF
ncbi:MAG: CRISPR-associated helicase Cas3' [Desulfobacteraceae bacterium]|nr:CRISPR-associated helicase Cas3' [Desulfobacteraceae bacterium]